MVRLDGVRSCTDVVLVDDRCVVAVVDLRLDEVYVMMMINMISSQAINTRWRSISYTNRHLCEAKQLTVKRI